MRSCIAWSSRERLSSAALADCLRERRGVAGETGDASAIAGLMVWEGRSGGVGNSDGYSLADEAVIMLACAYCGVCCDRLESAARPKECAWEECVDVCDELCECEGECAGDANGLGM
jgi:hypothetical protein